jgi:peptidoglycan/xylan/chitin deacetylase (PgdA/CDA1 family)
MIRKEQQMTFRALVLCAAALAFSGCDKLPKPRQAASTPSPTPAATATPAPTPTPEPTPTPFALDKSSQVIVFCYHRFEQRPKDYLAINPAEFEAQMQALKDKGITVIPMDDFLAWRRGEKNIPAKSAVISIDDGYLSAYAVGWPILQKFGYPFTMYVYTDYVRGGSKSGGASMTWEQLGEMRDAGVDIASHTISHSNLRDKKKMTDEQYRQWVESELAGSKKILEQKLGIKVKTLAYPYGNHNELVREVAMQAGYEAAFSVYGKHLRHNDDAAMIGRYAISSREPANFNNAVNFAGAAVPSSAGTQSETVEMPAAGGMVTQPMKDETISDPKPEIKINLAALGAVDPKTVEMRISGIGIVPAKYDAASQMLSYKTQTRLRDRDVTVIVSARANGRKAVASWTFHYDPAAPTTPTPAPSVEPAAASPATDAEIPAMKPAQ